MKTTAKWKIKYPAPDDLVSGAADQFRQMGESLEDATQQIADTPPIKATPVTTVTPATTPSASYTGGGYGGSRTLALKLPRAARISIGTVTTAANAKPASASTTTDANGDVKLNLTLPKGDPGAPADNHVGTGLDGDGSAQKPLKVKLKPNGGVSADSDGLRLSTNGQPAPAAESAALTMQKEWGLPVVAFGDGLTKDNSIEGGADRLKVKPANHTIVVGTSGIKVNTYGTPTGMDDHIAAATVQEKTGMIGVAFGAGLYKTSVNPNLDIIKVGVSTGLAFSGEKIAIDRLDKTISIPMSSQGMDSVTLLEVAPAGYEPVCLYGVSGDLSGSDIWLGAGDGAGGVTVIYNNKSGSAARITAHVILVKLH